MHIYSNFVQFMDVGERQRVDGRSSELDSP